MAPVNNGQNTWGKHVAKPKSQTKWEETVKNPDLQGLKLQIRLVPPTKSGITLPPFDEIVIFLQICGGEFRPDDISKNHSVWWLFIEVNAGKCKLLHEIIR